MPLVHFEDDEFRHALATLLVDAGRGDADAEEVLATAARVRDGDADSWVLEWVSTAGAAWAAARSAADPLTQYRHAAAYYAAALRPILRSTERERWPDLWRRGRACWDRIVDLLGGERIAIPYEDTTLPGYFFRAPDAAPGERRPVVIMNGGGEESTSAMLGLGGATAGQLGHHWMTFDGPGQGAALVEQGLTFRPDWEAVLTPVLDALVEREDVDGDRVAVVGVGQGGYWVPRALAFEHRVAAAVADPGVLDVSAAWIAPLPRRMRQHLRSGQAEAFDREMRLALLFWPELAGTLETRAAPYGLRDAPASELFATISRYRLGDEVEAIDTPLLVTVPERQRYWSGQSEKLFDRLGGPKALAHVRTEDRQERIFAWIGDVFANVRDGAAEC
ncbi:hypothetical protein OJ997_32175 [Solirubrobacter phytolaccae]|uniref:Dipeptidyl aminopeptidase n=1 Tax=Solirubrobacter phytolaccae TaxID=1404360 RepID=A0A9X3NK37_9ACTN|nr:hypothetical protein [Solirubrobacter phytolaccae]MDA0185006.1 hypothetical protein [Solirubrobacter phytolaccae]